MIGGGPVDALKLASDAEAKPAKPPVQQPIVLQGSTGEFFDHNKGIYFTGPRPGWSRRCIPTSRQATRRPTCTSSGRPVHRRLGGHVATPRGLRAAGRQPDGKLFLARSNVWGFGGWRGWTSGSSRRGRRRRRHVVSFVPFDTQQPANRDIKWARFTDADHVIAMSGNGLVALFEVKAGAAAKAVWSAEAEAQATPALSAGGKYLAVGMKGNEIAVVETATGRTLGRTGRRRHVGFAAVVQAGRHPVGRRRAGPAHDLGPLDRQARPRPDAGRASGSQIAWPAEGFVLLDGQYLVAWTRR